MGTKKLPMRMCTGCREMKPKSQLVRVVKTPEGEIRLDTGGKLNGRGAYICKNSECMKKAVKSNAFARAFDTAIPGELYERLEEELRQIE